MDPIVIILIGTAVVLFCIIVLKLHAVISLLFAALVTGLLTSPDLILNYAIHSGLSDLETQSLSNLGIGRRLAQAFGNTSGKIGILIALASIIGVSLMRSGAAERIVRSLLGLFGKKNASVAFLTGSFTLAIPVFFDTVFYLMIPIVKSIGVRNPKKFGLYLMTVMAGGVMAHSLIPPTPGPLFVAEEMGIDLGTMIIAGLVIGIITVLGGYAYSVWATRKWDLPMRDTPDISVEDLKEFSEKEKKDLNTLEAVFFISGRFLSMQDLISLSDLKSVHIESLIKKLKHKYSKLDNALEIVEKKGLWKMDVKREYSHIINKLASGNVEFTKAEQETLAIIAYKQPMKQSVLIKIRGNKAYDNIKKFADLNLIRKKKMGHTYELTLSDEFYDYFNINKSDNPLKSLEEKEK